MLMTQFPQQDVEIHADAWRVVLPLKRPIGTPAGPFREVSCVVVRLGHGAHAVTGPGLGRALREETLKQFGQSI